MPKVTLTDLSNLQNEATAVAQVNNNNTLIENAIEDTLSRSGTSPNSMSASLDMNSNQILNLPDAVLDQEPLTLGQFNDAVSELSAGELIPATTAIISGAGLTGGGALTAGLTLAVGAGTGITVNANDVALTIPVPGTSLANATASTTGATRLPTLAVITSTNAAWPIPVGTLEMTIEAWGGGGSGAGSLTGSTQRRGGGGAGGYVYKVYTGTMDSTLNITVGTGGAAVNAANTGTAGNNGVSTTVVGSNLGTLTAALGQGCPNDGAGGAGGAGTNGDINMTGQSGMVQPVVVAAGVGEGGTAYKGGFGGRANVGSAGASPGGGGACSNHTGIGDASGAGARGEVRIWTR